MLRAGRRNARGSVSVAPTVAAMEPAQAEDTELGIDARRCGLDPAQPAGHRRRDRFPGNLEVGDRLRRLSAPELLAKGCQPYERYRLTLNVAGGAPLEHTRDVLRGGKVVEVMPIDRARDEVVL